MNAAKIALTVFCSALIALPALALDRGARSVDWLTVGTGLYDDGDSIDVMIWDEQAAHVENGNISWLVGAGYSYNAPDEWKNDHGFRIATGVKVYPIEPLSIGIIGQYEGYGDGMGIDVWSAYVDGKFRLVPADYPVSPFVRGIAGLRSVENEYTATPNRSTQAYFQAGGGTDIAMTERFSLVVEGMFSASEGSSQFYSLDGIVASLSMKYYFD